MSRSGYLRMQLESAWLSLWMARFRSFLAGVGVTIGVAAVILVIAVGEGSRQKILDQIQLLGSNLLVVNPGPASTGPALNARVNSLSREDAEAIQQNLGKAVAVSPEVYGQAVVSRGTKARNAPLLGAQPSFFLARNFFPAQGRIFNQSEEKSMRRVCLLGSTLAAELFSGQSPLEKKIRVNGAEYEVIGVLEPKGDFGWFHPDQLVLAPLRLVQRQLLGIDFVHSITVKFFSEPAMADTRDEIVRILRIKHRLSPALGKDQLDFNVVSQTELIRTFNKVNRTFTSLLVSIAVISLLVGGIGIMNIMLANLSERIGEIGIRKAVGARRTDILWQFLFESLTITSAGAGFGVVSGIAAAGMLESFSSWQTEIRAWSVLAGAGFASLIGLVFGIYPAWRASGLDPMAALRKE